MSLVLEMAHALFSFCMFPKKLQFRFYSACNSFNLTTLCTVADALMVSAGLYHTCAVMVNGSILCWGLNQDGQLGTGNTANTYRPTAVIGLYTGEHYNQLE
jgi:alpha-tubulin suppressor-like RCC1 family protein